MPPSTGRRKQIIDRAAAVVYRQGFGATTVADILVAARVGKGNFYHYFRGKEDLGLAIIDGLAQQYAGVELDSVFSAEKPPLRRLDEYVELVRTARRSNNCGDPLCTLASELGLVSPYAERIAAVMGGLLARLETAIGEIAIERKIAVDAAPVARAALAQIHGACVQYKVGGDAAAFDAALGGVRAIVTNALDAAARQRSAVSGTITAIAG
jgi:TetR/AcrR family transcriptional regulator, transcriptional repressor for nem operon